jgi:hypothetical protein
MSSNQSVSKNQLIEAELSGVKAELSGLKAEISALRAELQKTASEPSVKKPRAKKVKAEGSGDESEPKEKRAPSAYIIFSSKVVGPLVRRAIEGTETKLSVGTITQFAGHLWAQKKEWSEDDILAEWESYTPPEVSKQALAGKNKTSSTGSAEKKEPVADEKVESEEKPKSKPQSEETKKAAAEKRAATKAKKAAETAAPAAPAPAEAEDQIEDIEPEVAAPSTPLTIVLPVVKKAKIAPKPKKEVDLFLDPWTHDGEEYIKNERGDVLTTDGLWVGRWNGKVIDESAPEPADFEDLTTRD